MIEMKYLKMKKLRGFVNINEQSVKKRQYSMVLTCDV